MAGLADLVDIREGDAVETLRDVGVDLLLLEASQSRPGAVEDASTAMTWAK